MKKRLLLVAALGAGAALAPQAAIAGTSGSSTATGTNGTGTGTGTWTLASSAVADAYGLQTLNGSPSGGFSEHTVTTTAQCDNAFNPAFGNNCTATAGQVAHENLGLSGPTSSSGTATTYATTVTWIAAP